MKQRTVHTKQSQQNCNRSEGVCRISRFSRSTLYGNTQPTVDNAV